MNTPLSKSPWARDMSPEMARFISDLPKTEHHLHIEGTTPYDRLQRLQPEAYRDAPEHWGSEFRFDSFDHFLHVLGSHGLAWFTSPERYALAAEDIFARALTQNVRYIELSFDANFAAAVGAGPCAIAQAIHSVVPDGLEVVVFMGMTRDAYVNGCAEVIDQALRSEFITGIDLHGTEPLPLLDWTKRIWEAARAEGKVTKAHAGEFGPASNVREAVEILGVQRVQHGVRAVEDQAVLDLLGARGVILDVCPISNVKLKVVPSPEAHPLRKLIDAGIACTISTDDPFAFNNTLEEEYAFVHTTLGFGRDELRGLARQGIRNALVSEQKRKAWLDELEGVGKTGASAS